MIRLRGGLLIAILLAVNIRVLALLALALVLFAVFGGLVGLAQVRWMDDRYASAAIFAGGAVLALVLLGYLPRMVRRVRSRTR